MVWNQSFSEKSAVIRLSEYSVVLNTIKLFFAIHLAFRDYYYNMIII